MYTSTSITILFIAIIFTGLLSMPSIGRCSTTNELESSIIDLLEVTVNTPADYYRLKIGDQVFEGSSARFIRVNATNVVIPTNISLRISRGKGTLELTGLFTGTKFTITRAYKEGLVIDREEFMVLKIIGLVEGLSIVELPKGSRVTGVFCDIIVNETFNGNSLSFYCFRRSGGAHFNFTITLGNGVIARVSGRVERGMISFTQFDSVIDMKLRSMLRNTTSVITVPANVFDYLKFNSKEVSRQVTGIAIDVSKYIEGLYKVVLRIVDQNQLLVENLVINTTIKGPGFSKTILFNNTNPVKLVLPKNTRLSITIEAPGYKKFSKEFIITRDLNETIVIEPKEKGVAEKVMEIVSQPLFLVELALVFSIIAIIIALRGKGHA